MGLTHIMLRTHFRNSVLRVASSTVDVGREKSKKRVGAPAMKPDVVDDSSYLFLGSARNYQKFVYDGFLVQSTWR